MESSIFFFLLICCLSSQEAKDDLSDTFCSEWIHHTYGKGSTCCNHKLIFSGVNEQTYWDECTAHPRNEKEDFTTSIWRVYSCVLTKSLPAQDRKITFTKFATLMTSNYTAALKTSILEKVKKEVGSAGNKTYLKDTILLTDYVQLDKIRAAYFDIEKSACGLKNQPKEEQFDKCDLEEEINHREGDCCGKTPVPFVDHHLDAFQDFEGGATCAKTLEKKVKATKLKYQEDIDTFLEECNFACYLIEEKLIKIDDFLKLTSKSKIQTSNIVKKFVPTYVSETIGKWMETYVNDHLNLTEIFKGKNINGVHHRQLGILVACELPDTVLGDKVQAAELFPCYAYNQIYTLTKHAIYQHCHSHD